MPKKSGTRTKLAWLAGAVAAVTVAAIPATAGGVPRSEVEPGYYGGGRILPTVAQSERDSAVVAVRVARDRRSVRLYSEARLRCEPSLEGVDVRTKEISLRTPLRADGTFRARRDFETGFETRPSVVDVDFTGRFDARGRVSGVLEVTQQIKSATGEVLSRCESGRVRWRAARPAVREARGRPASGASYYGNTAQIGTQLATDTPRIAFKFPIMLRVSQARSLSHAIFYWRANCATGPGIPLRKPPPLPIGARLPSDGRFSIRRTETDARSSPRETERNTISIAGKVGTARAAGTLNIRTVVTEKGTGAVRARCDTGRVRWRAERYG